MNMEERSTVSIEESVFQKWAADQEALRAYGFVQKTDASDGALYLEKPFMDGDFLAELSIDAKGILCGRVIDCMSGEEYIPLRIAGHVGSFVSTVRYAYEELLTEIRDACFLPLPFVSGQANRITAQIHERFREKPDFPFSGGSDDTSGVFRNPGNRKWYGIIMRIPEDKLDPSRKQKDPCMIDVINLKIREEDGETLRKRNGIYPAWHMNHRSWVSLRLDETLPDEQIMELVEISRGFTIGSGKTGGGRDGCKSWIVPANPKYYDLIPVFDAQDETHWKQGKGIEVGDIVYMYVAAPWSAILYRCLVTKTHLPYEKAGQDRARELMNVRILDRYDKKAFGLNTVMKRFGVVGVRGPRFMPEELIRYIDKHK